MKQMIVLMILLNPFSTVMSQTDKKYKEITIVQTSEVIQVSADSLWKIAREFQEVAVWSSNIKHATGDGEPEFKGATCSERTCHVEGIGGYNKVVEKLILFSDANRELAYEMIEGAPGFVIFARNHWTVSEAGPNQSVIKMHVTMRLKRFAGFFLGGQLKKTVLKNLPIAMQELKVYAETGQVSEAKKNQLREQERKRKKAA